MTRLRPGGIERRLLMGRRIRGASDAREKQQHQIFPTLDLNFSPDWEFNLGIGIGLTRRTDDLMVKLILGRRF